jgi:hypothetical protein
MKMVQQFWESMKEGAKSEIWCHGIDVLVSLALVEYVVDFLGEGS